MQYRRDKNGNNISALGFGCMRFPKKYGRIDFEKTEALIVEAVEKGINYFDTAYIYTGSEVTLGEVLNKNKLREKVYIATKLPIVFCKSESDFDKYLEAQLKRLQTDYIDYYLLHLLSDPAKWEQLQKIGIEGWLKKKQAEGKIHQVGFSFHGRRDDFPLLLDVFDWDFCMIQYNYVNINYQAGRLGLLKAAEKKLPVFIMEPLLGGKLAIGLPEKAVRLFEDTAPGRSPAAWSLRWLWNHTEVTMVLSGMNEFSQLEDNLATVEDSLPEVLAERELEAVDRVVELFMQGYKIPCTGCNYCMPCPTNINIPACFTAYNTTFSAGRYLGMHQYSMSTGFVSPAPGNAGRCTKCRKCEKHCPQQIIISERMQDVKRRMEPFWYRLAVKIARFFMRIKGSY